ncbi:MAG: hypothetical protein ACYTG6_15805, partial [Planctomycetota bacterium]
MHRILSSLVVLGVLLVPALDDARAGPSFSDLEKALRERLKSEDDTERARAFDVLEDCDDPRAVVLIIRAVKDIVKEQEKIRAAQVKEEAKYEELFNRKLKADRWFENSNRTGRDLDRYNKEVGKIRRLLDAARLRVKSLENDFTRTRAQIDGAVMMMTKVLAKLSAEDFPAALEKVEQAWLNSRSPVENLRWLDAVSGLDRPTIGERIQRIATSQERDPALRAAALLAMTAREDPAAHALAVTWLQAPAETWDLIAAAISSLRAAHRREGSEPLIEFLKREDLKRLREDAH